MDDLKSQLETVKQANPEESEEQGSGAAVQEAQDGIITPLDTMVPVVGLGGSHGSLNPLQIFFEHLPAETGTAYVVVVHLSPEHESILATILQRSTPMPVSQIAGTVRIQPDHVYVIPPGKHLTMENGLLSAVEFERPKRRHVTVDLFFRTLAETHGIRATAVVLSGGDGDGANGLKRIKERGGLTIAQDPSEAENDGMPRAAIATGMVDWVLPVKEMPGKILAYMESGRRMRIPPLHPVVKPLSEPPEEVDAERTLGDILALLKTRSGHDFSCYKRATILRRIARRMQVNSAETLQAYLDYLRTHPGESGALLQDLLISVTNFFRDREAFLTLERHIAELFKGKQAADQVRVWVPACATGEEAYSIAILLCEHAAKCEFPPQIQVFATDLDQSAIEVAREGRYSSGIVADVSDQRLRDFFVKEADGYRLRSSVREIVLFALHDILKDSPFSRLDLVSCRNLLIYLKREAQGKVFEIFHFALAPGAKLFLGASESAEDVSTLFSHVDKKHRLYQRRSVPRVGLSVPVGAPTMTFAYNSLHRLPGIHVPAGNRELPIVSNFSGPRGGDSGRPSWGEMHFKMLEQLAPPSILISSDHQVLHVSERAGKYLQIVGGEPSVNLLRIIHPQLRTELRAALFLAAKSKAAVNIANAPVSLDGETCLIEISVELLEGIGPDFMLVIFREKEGATALKAQTSLLAGETGPNEGVVKHLEDELDLMRTNWRETVEQYETSAEELKASNEELQAMNEELRSATEELETGREELQSINEEIITINQELKSKVEELSRANNDLQNLMASTKIATIFLNRNLQINRFTPSTLGLFNFIVTDIGRPLSDVTHRLEYTEISKDAERVLETLTSLEREVRNLDGKWFLARMFPYRTTEDLIAGVVITFVDITERKVAEEARIWLSAIVESSNDAIISFSLDGDILSWNQGAERIFGYQAQEVIGQSLVILAPDHGAEEKREMLERLRRGEAVTEFDTVRRMKSGKLIDVSLSISVIKDEKGEIVGATAIAQDITERMKAVEELRQARDHLEARVVERTSELSWRVKQLAQMTSEVTLTEQRERLRMAHVLHDELQQLLVAAKMKVEALQDGRAELREDEIGKIITLIDETLENSRSLAVDLSPPILGEGLGKAVFWLCEIWMKEKYHLQVHSEIDQTLDTPHEDMRTLVFLAVKELLFNVVKHSTVKEAWVTLVSGDKGFLELTVKDHGLGFEATKLGKLGGSASGFGLLSLQERLRILGADLDLESTPAGGVKAVIRVPAEFLRSTDTPPTPS